MSIRDEPHYELPASELAAWIEAQGLDRWWSVDGDRRLTGHVAFPCPAHELLAVLRRIQDPLLLRDKAKSPTARGQRIGRNDLDALAMREGDGMHVDGEKPLWADNRSFDLCWKGSDEEWTLHEDLESTEAFRGDAA